MDTFDETALRHEAEMGNSEAQMALATALWRTEIPNSQLEAMRWFERAAESGGAEYKQFFGSLLCEPGPLQDFPRGFALLKQAAEMGDLTAQYSVAAELAMGEHVTRDPSSAAAWYARAADGGSAEAAYNLAIMHIEGDGVRVDKQKALALLERAGSAGELLALRALAEGYEGGANGLPVDPIKARIWRTRYEAVRNQKPLV